MYSVLCYFLFMQLSFNALAEECTIIRHANKAHWNWNWEREYNDILKGIQMLKALDCICVWNLFSFCTEWPMKMQVDYKGQSQWDIRGSRSQSFYTDHQHFLKTSFSPFSAWPAVVSSMNSPLLSCAMIVTYRHWMWWMSLYSTPSHYPILRRAEQCFNSRWYNKEVHLFI